MHALKIAFRCIYRALADTVNHDGIEHAGYLTFLGLLAIFPFLVLVFSIVGLIGAGETGAMFITNALDTLPTDATEALKPRILEIISGPPQGLLTVAILGAIWTSSSAVEGMRTILNRAYHVATPPAYWRRRLLSILQLLIFTFILVTGILFLVVIPLMLHSIETLLGVAFLLSTEAVLGHIAWLITIGIVFLAVCYIYYIIPNLKQRIISVAPGAAAAVLLWLAAAWGLTQYLSHFQQVNLIYGSLGGIIAAMIFLYLCNVIFIFGAALNHQIVVALRLRMEQRESVTGALSSHQ
jgi:membrane protein